MDTRSSDSYNLNSAAQGELWERRPGELDVTAHTVHRLHEQLGSSLKRLVRTMNTLVYTRNPIAIAVVAQQCDQVDGIAKQLDRANQCMDVHGLASGQVGAADPLLLIDTYQMLAEARRLVSVPLRPVWRDDNVVDFQPDYGDLTDAAFERMLASSDIPQLLADANWWVDAADLEEPSKKNFTQLESKLRLVYSSDRPQNKD